MVVHLEKLGYPVGQIEKGTNFKIFQKFWQKSLKMGNFDSGKGGAAPVVQLDNPDEPVGTKYQYF